MVEFTEEQLIEMADVALKMTVDKKYMIGQLQGFRTVALALFGSDSRAHQEINARIIGVLMLVAVEAFVK